MKTRALYSEGKSGAEGDNDVGQRGGAIRQT